MLLVDHLTIYCMHFHCIYRPTLASYECLTAYSHIRSSLKDDRVYKFVKSVKSLKADELPMEDSIEWKGVSNAVEVYKLPTSMLWPTMCCPKQKRKSSVFSEFIIRRMNNLHRHRVLATMNRLWSEPEEINSFSDEKVIWAGSPGCGKTMAVNEIILESVLKLNEIGKENKTRNLTTMNQFFFRNVDFLIRFYFDTNGSKVTFEILSFESLHNLIKYMNNEIAKNRKSFVIYEMDEKEIDPVIDMPFLLSTSCRDLRETIKSTWKNHRNFYLYDPVLYFEFEFFLNVSYAFGRQPRAAIGELLGRFPSSGGIMRNIFDPEFTSPVSAVFDNNVDHLSVFTSLKDCNPVNIIPFVNSIVGVKFRLPLQPVEEDEKFLAFASSSLYDSSFYPVDSALFEFCHLRKNWCVEYLSDEIAIEMGKKLSLPYEIQCSNSSPLYQIQELVNIYSGILKTPNRRIKLPDSFYIVSWEFFSNPMVCTSKNLCYSHKSVKIEVSSASLRSDNENLISMMPMTTKILTFQGQYLQTPFKKLLSSYVYRSSVHNGPVFDALTADPAAGRLFLFQSTLKDPFDHPVSITAFNKVLSNLKIDYSDSDHKPLKEIYLYMIASAHQNYTSQHFFSFTIGSLYLSACFLSVYASAGSIKTLEKVISVQSGKAHKYTTKFLTPEEMGRFTDKELSLLKTIGGCYVKEGLFNKISIDQDLYDDLFLFLKQHASKLRPFVCRVEFNASNTFKVAEKASGDLSKAE